MLRQESHQASEGELTEMPKALGPGQPRMSSLALLGKRAALVECYPSIDYRPVQRVGDAAHLAFDTRCARFGGIAGCCSCVLLSWASLASDCRSPR